MKTVKKAAIVGSVLALLTSCAVGRNHTPDLVLQERFGRRELEFTLLLAEVTADEKLTMIGVREVNYAGHRFTGLDGPPSETERLGLSKQRWTRYQEQLHNLGLVQVIKGNDWIEFRVDPGTLFNGDSYKGYCYATTPPYPEKESLDDYRISDSNKGAGGWGVSKRLKGNWSLYLFVNR